MPSLRQRWMVAMCCFVLCAVACQSNDPPHVKDIKKLKDKVHPDIRIETILRLGSYSSHAATIAPHLQRELTARTGQERRAAVSALFQLGPHTAVVHALLAGFATKNERVHLLTIQAFQKWQNNISYAIRIGLSHKQADVRIGTLVYLTKNKHHMTPQVTLLVGSMRKDADPRVRQLVALHALRSRQFSPEIMGIVARELKGSSSQLKRQLMQRMMRDMRLALLATTPLLRPKTNAVPTRIAAASLLLALIDETTKREQRRKEQNIERQSRRKDSPAWPHKHNRHRKNQIHRRRQSSLYWRQSTRLRRLRALRRRMRRGRAVNMRSRRHHSRRPMRALRKAFRAGILYPTWHPQGQLHPRRNGKIVRPANKRGPKLSWYASHATTKANPNGIRQLVILWPSLYGALKDPNAQVRRIVLRASEQLRKHRLPMPGYTTALAHLLQDTMPTLREQARKILAKRAQTFRNANDRAHPQFDEPALVKAFIAYLKGNETTARQFALTHLPDVGPRGVDALPHLMALCRPPNASITLCQKAIRTAGYLGPKAFPPLQKQWLRKDTTPKQRLALLEAISRTGHQSPAYTALLQAAAAGKYGNEELLRVYGILGLRHIPPTTQSLQQLQGYLKAKRWTLRSAALETIKHLGKRAKSLLPSVLPLLNDPKPQVKDRILPALSALSCQHPKVQEAIKDGLTDQRSERRIASAKALSQCPYKEKMALQPLQFMHQAPSWRERLAALEAMGTKHPEALQRWLRASNDKAPELRKAVRRTLWQFKSCPPLLQKAVQQQLDAMKAAFAQLDPKGLPSPNDKKATRTKASKTKAPPKDPSRKTAPPNPTKPKLKKPLRKLSPKAQKSYYDAMEKYRRQKQIWKRYQRNAFRKRVRMQRNRWRKIVRMKKAFQTVGYSRWMTMPDYIPTTALLKRWHQEATLIQLLGELQGKCYPASWKWLQTQAGWFPPSFKRGVQRQWQTRLLTEVRQQNTKKANALLRSLLEATVVERTKEKKLRKRPKQRPTTHHRLLDVGFLLSLFRPYPGLLIPQLKHPKPPVRRLAVRMWGAWLRAHHPYPMRRRNRHRQKHKRSHMPGFVIPLSKNQQNAALRILKSLLKDKDSSIQLVAFGLLQEVQPKQHWLPTARKSLKAKYAPLRQAAFRALTTHTTIGQMWRTALKLTNDPDAPVRHDALKYVLRSSPDNYLLPVLVRLAKDPSPAIRQLVARQLKRLIPTHKAATAALKKLRTDRHNSVRIVARRQWHGLFGNKHHGFNAMLKRLLTPRHRRRRGVAYQLRTRFRSKMPFTINWLKSQLKSKDSTRRSHVVLALKELRHPRAVPLIASARRDRDPKIRRLADAVWRAYGPITRSSQIGPICARIDQAGPAAKIELLKELRTLVNYNWKLARPTVARALKDPVPQVRVAAVWVLRAMQTKAIALLKPMRADPHHHVRIAVANTLGSMGMFARHLLVPLLRDTHPDVRNAAKKAFRKKRRY